MKTCVLDGQEIDSREALHDKLETSLALPCWYGRNLDALYDCLTEMPEEAHIRILHGEALKEHLGVYAETLEKVIRMAAEGNPRIRQETI